MDDNELLRLLHYLEADRVERKRSLSDKDRISEAICAFANDMPGHNLPGVLFVGANDDGSCAGQAITDEVQRFGVGIAIARQELGKNNNPPPEFVVEDAHVLVIVRRRQ